MHWGHQGVGGGGEQAAAVKFAAVRTEPALPEAPEPEGLAIAAAKAAPLLKKGIGRHQGAVMAPGAAKTGFFRHGFAAGKDRAAGGAGIAGPGRQQAPEGQGGLDAALILAAEQHRLPRQHLIAAAVMAGEAWGQAAPQPGLQPLEAAGE